MTTFTPFEIEHDRPHLTPLEQAAGGSFEWWYFDCQTDDGVQFVILFSLRNPVFASGRPSVYIEFKDPTQALHHVCNYDAAEFSWSEAGDTRTMRIGPNELTMAGSSVQTLRYELTLALPWISARLTATPLHRGFLPGADGCYFRATHDPARRTCVSFSAPVMNVGGEMTVRGTSVRVNGAGYHDHPWGTAQLFFTHHEWHWGRVADASTRIMFADVRPSSDFEGSLRFMYKGVSGQFEPTVSGELDITPSDWRRDSWHGIRCPHTLQVSSNGDSWNARVGAMMLDTPVYNRAVASWTPLPSGSPGSGWVEYYHLQQWLGNAALLGGRCVAFSWRPFPYFGK